MVMQNAEKFTFFAYAISRSIVEDSEKPFKTTKFADTLFKEYLRKVIYWEVIRSPL